MAKKIRIIPWLDESQLNKQLNQLGKRQQKIKVDIDNGNINNTNKNMQQINKTVANSNSIFGKLRNTIGNTFSSGKIALTGYLMVLNEISKAGKNAKQTIQEIDQAVTDLSIATNQSREAVSALVKDYNTYAKQLGSTTIQVTSAADDYLRAGKSMNEAQALIKDSIMLSKLGQLNSSEATEDLLATMNGFEMSIEDVGKALDAMVAIDMAAATSSGDISTALKYCASSADVAGLSFNKLAAMIGAVQDKTQQSAETIGTFFNTLLSRYRDVKINKFISDDGEDLSDVESVLGSLDIKLRDSNEEFREFEIVIDEVAKSWSKYSSVQQAAIAKAFSGTRQQNRFIALMEGYNKTLELTEVAANSAGTAVEKFENLYMNSLEAKQNALQASFESMILSSDFDNLYSGILSATTALVDFVNQTNALNGAFAGLAVSSGIKFFLAMKTGINEAYISLNQFSNALKIVKQTNISTADFDKLLLLSDGLSTSQMKLLLSSNQLSIAQKELILTNSGLSAEEAKLQLQTWGMVSAETGLTAATTTLGNAFKGLMATMSANPFMFVAMVVSGAVMAFQSYSQKMFEAQEKAKEAMEEAVSEYESAKSSLQSINSELDENKQKIEELESKGKLTYVEKEQLETLKQVTEQLELQKEIAEWQLANKQREAALSAITYVNAKYNLGDSNVRDVDKLIPDISAESYIGLDIAFDEDVTDAEYLAAQYKNVSAELQNLIDKRKELDNDSPEAAVLDSQIAEYRQGIEDLQTEMNNMLSTLTEQKANMQDYFDSIKDTPYEEMSTDAKSCYDAMQQINAAMQTLYYGYGNNRFNNEVIDQIFGTEGIEKSKEELIEMAEAGTLNPAVLASYKGLADAILNSNLVADEGCGVFETLCNEIYALAEAEKEVQDSVITETPVLSISETIDQLNNQLKPAFDSLKSAYEDIFTTDGFTLKNVDLSMLDSIKSALDDLNKDENGITIDYSAFEELARVLTDTSSTADDVKRQFNELANTIVYATDTAEVNSDTFDVLVKSMEEMGLVNAREVLTEMIELEKEFQAVSEDLGLTIQDVTNATYEETVQMLIEAQAAGKDTTALFQLAVAKGKITDGTIETESNVDALIAEATAAGLDISVLTALENVRNGNIKDSTAAAHIMENARQKILDTMSGFTLDFNFDGVGGGKKSAGKSGKEAGDAYVEAFEKELEELERLRDEGKITEKEYLDALRALYQKYFKDRKEYLKEYQKYENQYLKGMKSLYEDALSGITKLIDEQIDAYEEQKDAALDALESERDAALEVLEAQIKKKEKIISSIQSEIDAMREANEERKRQVTLQEKLYQLERMQNQRTILQYSEEKGMHYVQDLEGVRKAKDEVDDVKLEIEIANKEKQISLLEKEIDLLEGRKDATNEYYDKLIADTEKYWDELIKNMEDYKSRWEELAEIEERAKIISTLEQLGITTEDILNMSGEAFEKFKGEYVGVLADLYRDNDSMTNALAQSLGTTTDKLGSYIQSTQEYIDSLNGSADSLQPVSDAIDETSESMDTLSSSASGASSSVSNISNDMDSLNTSTDGLSDNINGISKALTDVPEADKFNAIVDAFTNLASAIQSVSDALGIGSEGTVGGLVGALQSIKDISLGGDNGEGIISQFNNLKTAIESVTNAISGGGLSSTQGGDSSASASMSFGAGGQDSASGLIGVINEIQTTTDSALGSGGEEGTEGEGSGAISKFDQLKTTVDDVSTAIGNEDNQDEESLIGSIVDLGESTEEILKESGDDGVIGRFEQFRDVIGEAENHVEGINKWLDEIDGKEVECTIHINVDQNGSIPSAVGDANVNGTAFSSAEYTAKLGAAHVEGTALASGNWAVQSDEKSALMGEVGYEIIVRNGRFFTVGERGAEMVPIKKGDIVFNHEQSVQLLKNGHISGRGKAYADGTVGDKFASGVLRPLQPGDRMWELTKKAEEYMKQTGEDVRELLSPVNSINRDMGKMAQSISTISNIDNSNRMQNVTNTFNISLPNVNDSTKADALLRDLQSIALKKEQFFNMR